MVGVYAAEVVGLIDFPSLPPLYFGDLILVVMVFCIVVFLLQVGSQNLNRALDQSRHNEQVLAQRTAELAESHANLEQEMAARMQAEQERAQLQQQLIRELSTPIIPVLERIIVMPLVGSIDDTRARDITRALLAGIRQHRAQVVILDITGVPLVDSGVVSHLNKTIQAARLKGARTIITGISDAVAETIVDLEIDWSKTETLSDLQTGLLAALQSMGIELTRQNDIVQ
jgi:rsbT co-antagonist protein RsbR